MTVWLKMWIACMVTASEAIPCNETHHCSDCDRDSGNCLTECDTGYYDRQCKSACSRNCRNNKCVISNHGNDNCTYGCIPGYQGTSCNIPCDSPGGNCTVCPGGCDGEYCQLGSSCVFGCVDSYYGTDCNIPNCSNGCKDGTCTLSSTGDSNCTDGCVPGYQGIGCNIPCDSPGGSCTACPGGCDGEYCQLGSSCVSGCIDTYYGTDCKNCSRGCTSCNRLTGNCHEKQAEDVGVLMGLSVSLAIASVLVIVIVVLAVCWRCRPLRRDRFQLYVTPTQDTHAPTENIDAPQYASSR